MDARKRKTAEMRAGVAGAGVAGANANASAGAEMDADAELDEGAEERTDAGTEEGTDADGVKTRSWRDISYIASEKIICPVCSYELHREELRSGRGRIVVDTLTQELRHTYKPTEKYGVVIPPLYTITVCPRCLYAAFKMDFSRINRSALPGIKRTHGIRVSALNQLLPNIDFRKPRGLPEGIASYYYALLCYQHWAKMTGPTIRQGLATLRIAWLCTDYNAQQPGENWDVVARIFYRKARHFYRLALERDETREENIPNDFNVGPDTDENYGIDGVRYLANYLEFQWGPNYAPKVRRVNLQRIKANVSQLFKAQAGTPQAAPIILSNARLLHTAANAELRSLPASKAP